MPMTKEQHESLLMELLSPELDQSRRTEILQEMRTDYGVVHSDFDTLTATKSKLETNNYDLVVANSHLFRQLGTVGTDEASKKEEQQQTFSETVTISELEKSLNL